MSLPNKGKLLALDMGKAYTGVAICDFNQSIAFPREEIKTKNEETLLSDLKKLIEADSIVGIIIGLPLSSIGEETRQSQWVRDTISKLDLKIPFIFADESYSTLNVGLDSESDAPTRKDSIVAQRILESVLNISTA